MRLNAQQRRRSREIRLLKPRASTQSRVNYSALKLLVGNIVLQVSGRTCYCITTTSGYSITAPNLATRHQPAFHQYHRNHKFTDVTE
jgi:hypothetical protein